MTELYVMLGLLIFFSIVPLFHIKKPKEAKTITTTWDKINEHRLIIKDITKYEDYYLLTDIYGIIYKVSQ